MSDHRVGSPRHTVAVRLAALLAVAVTAGCGALLGGPSTAPDGTVLPGTDELYTVTRTATLGATSGHVTGFLSENGESMMIDIEGATDGSNQRVRITTDREGSVTITTVDGKYYITGDWEFWAAASDPATANRLVDKTVVASPARVRDYLDLSVGTVLEEFFAPENLSLLDRVGSSVVSRVDGDRTVLIGRPKEMEFWVDADSRRLVKLRTTGADASELTLDRWDEAETFRAPKASSLVEY